MEERTNKKRNEKKNSARIEVLTVVQLCSQRFQFSVVLRCVDWYRLGTFRKIVGPYTKCWHLFTAH